MISGLLAQYISLDAKIACDEISDAELGEASLAQRQLLEEIAPPVSLAEAIPIAALVAHLLAKEEFPDLAVKIAADLALGLADLTAETR